MTVPIATLGHYLGTYEKTGRRGHIEEGTPAAAGAELVPGQGQDLSEHPGMGQVTPGKRQAMT